MTKVCISSDVIKPFSGEGDVVAGLKKVRLVVRIHKVGRCGKLAPTASGGGCFCPSHRLVGQIEALLKEAFTYDAFTAYRKLTMVRWVGKHVDVFAYKIRQLIELAGFDGAEMESFTKLAIVTGFPDTISIEL